MPLDRLGGRKSDLQIENDMAQFIDATKEGALLVKEYDDGADYPLLLCIGEDGPNIKITSDQGKTLHSALLRIYECVQS